MNATDSPQALATRAAQSAQRKRFLVRLLGGYAFRFGERVAVSASDREATVFGSPAEAAAAIARCGLASRRGLQIEEVLAGRATLMPKL
jgi:hypothetical protein